MCDLFWKSITQLRSIEVDLRLIVTLDGSVSTYRLFVCDKPMFQ